MYLPQLIHCTNVAGTSYQCAVKLDGAVHIQCVGALYRPAACALVEGVARPRARGISGARSSSLCTLISFRVHNCTLNLPKIESVVHTAPPTTGPAPSTRATCNNVIVERVHTAATRSERPEVTVIRFLPTAQAAAGRNRRPTEIRRIIPA